MLLRIEVKVAVVFLDDLFTSAVETFPFPLPGLYGRVRAPVSLPAGCIAASLPARL